MTLPPGTILQQMYFKRRLRTLRPGHFIEIGVGDGRLSRLLLDLGWTGTGYDLNGEALAVAADLNRLKVESGRYSLHQEDWLAAPVTTRADLILSCMVVEHLPELDERRYFDQCAAALAPGGRAILFVPGSPGHWGIEDDIAGHCRRYTFDRLRDVIPTFGWRLQHLAGLTFPLSNLLLPISNYLVRRAESYKLALSPSDQTRLSGKRDVPLKTSFPFMFGLLLNEYTLLPFHLLQMLWRNDPRSLVLYAEYAARE